MAGTTDPVRRVAMKAALALRAVVDLGPATSAAVATNSVRMTARQRRDERAGGSAVRRGPGELRSVQILAADPPSPDDSSPEDSPPIAGVRCSFAEAELELRFLLDDLVRLTWGPGDLPLPWALADPAGLSSGPPVVSVTVVEGPGGTVAGCTATSPALRVVVAADGSVRFFDPGGVELRHELPPLRQGASRTARYALRPGERVSGLGEQAGPVNLRGTEHRLWNRDPGGAWGPGQDPLYCAIPVLVGLHPEGDVLAFYENSYEAMVRIDGPETGVGTSPRVEIAFAGGVLRHYVAVGPLPRLMARYGVLTGRPPLPPRWALGYHQCKWGYKNETDVRGVADGFGDEGLPLSAIHLDIDYMDGYRVFSVDRERFPDLGSLAADLGARGVRVVTIVDPAVKVDPDYPVFAEGRAAARFLRDEQGELLIGVVWPGRAVFPDFTDPATRTWWAGWYHRLLDVGVAGVWHDMNEPTSITLWGDRTIPGGTRHAAEGRGGDHRECHNVYGQLMNQAGWDALRAERPDRRPFVLSRAGWAGVQRHAWNWTGDVESSWGGLRQQVATAIGLGLSGVAYTGSDIGGFSGVPSPELYLRWLELSVLMPFCRTHSVLGSPNREPWRFPEPHRAAIGRLIRLRYRLLPFLYSLAEEAHQLGHPLVRPLCWPAAGSSSPADRRLWQVDDAYLLGDALLVAPVTADGARSRSVPLPAGRWYRWRTLPAMADGVGEHPGSAPAGSPAAAAPGIGAPGPGTPGSGTPGSGAVADDEVSVVEGGRTVTLDAPAGQPVVLVREGSILVLDDGWADRRGEVALGHEPLLTALHCFPDAEGAAAGTGYDDAGDGYGPARRDRFRLTGVGGVGGVGGGDGVLRWDWEGDYDVSDRVRVVLHGAAITRAWADGTEVAVVVALGADTGPGGRAVEPASTIECGPFVELRLEG